MAYTLMIVEDNMIIAMDIKERLESYGYNVPVIAQNGETAVSMASRVHPDLILMDIGLGQGMNGIEAAQRIRRNEKTPVIFLTGNSHLLEGNERFLDKPFDEGELVALIRSTIEEERRR